MKNETKTNNVYLKHLSDNFCRMQNEMIWEYYNVYGAKNQPGIGKAVSGRYDNCSQPAPGGNIQFRRVFPMLWKTHKLFCRFPIFRRVFPGGNLGRRGKPGGKCGQPDPFPPWGVGYFGELCLPKSTPCGGPERMSNCYFSVKLPKPGKILPRFFSVSSGYFGACLL